MSFQERAKDLMRVIQQPVIRSLGLTIGLATAVLVLDSLNQANRSPSVPESEPSTPRVVGIFDFNQQLYTRQIRLIRITDPSTSQDIQLFEDIIKFPPNTLSEGADIEIQDPAIKTFPDANTNVQVRDGQLHASSCIRPEQTLPVVNCIVIEPQRIIPTDVNTLTITWNRNWSAAGVMLNAYPAPIENSLFSSNP